MQQRRGIRRAVVLGLTMALVLGACWGGDGDDNGSSPGEDDRRRSGPFTLRLGPGEAAGASSTPTPVARGDDLEDDEIAAITDRLPEFAGAADDRSDFRRPPEALPRPRVGRTVEEPFGPSDSPPPQRSDTGPLEVLRHQPDGEVDVAPFISVTFNQPMVPIGTLDQLDSADVPVTVEPEIDGRWRWIGTRTVRFEADVDGIDRLPAATDYTVEVPAGTESTSGSALGEAVRWTFSTPAPRVESFVPEGDGPRANVIDTEPVLLLTFDQRVDPDAVLDAVTLTAGDEARSIRLATDDEIAGDDIVRQRSEQALDGRWVAFRPADPLPTDTSVVVEVGPGTPSAEGPLRSDDAETFRTRTYAALGVARTSCGHGRGCRTGDPFTIELNNPLDPEQFDPQSIEIDPPMAASIAMYDSSIVIQGETTSDTIYEVTLPGSLVDRFGQTLGDDETVTFEVGDAAPFLRGFPHRVVTADPYADAPQVSVTSSGQEALKVSLYAVEPDDHPGYRRFMDRWDGEVDELPQWRRVGSTTVEVDGDPGAVSETTIDLTPALPEGRGHVVVLVEPTKTFPRDSEDFWMSRPTMAWVQATGIAVDAVADHDRLVAWATDLRDGTPIAGATVRLLGGGPATTDGDGLATIGLGPAADALLVERDGDSALLTSDHHAAWQASPTRDTARWSVFDDRGIYRPGEEAHVKGWVRRLTLSDDARIQPVGDGASVDYVVRDAFGNEAATGTAGLSSAGGFDFTIDVPDGAALGPAHVELSLSGADAVAQSGFSHEFLVEEFRRPEFEVETRAESDEPHVLTRPVTLAAQAGYFAGGPLAGAPVTWQVTTRPTSYSPPNWPDFNFGTWKPPWFEGFGDGAARGPGPFGYDREFGPCCPPQPDEEEEHHTYESRTDPTGSDYLRLDFEGEAPDEPITVSANAAVEDVNRQSFASTTDLLVHPASLYVGLRSARTFVRQGDALDIEAVVTDIDGEAVAGRDLTVTAARVVESFSGGEMTETEVDPQECEVTTEDEPVSCSFDTDVGGRYRITSTVTDDDGGRSRSELTRWVSGAEAVPSRGVDEQQVTIIPAEVEHGPGDTAELLVIAPFSPAHGLLTIARHGIEETRVFEISDGSTVLEVPITEDAIPGLDVRVDLAGAAERTRDDGSTSDDLPPRPAFATGSLSIPVSAATKTLDVTAVPRDRAVEPGGSTEVAVAVEDADGRPIAGAEVAVVVVDEAVLSLVGHELPDPVADMHQPLMEQLRADHLRRTLLLADPERFGAENAPATTITGEDFSDTSGFGAGDAGGAGAQGEAARDGDDAWLSAPTPATQSRTSLTAAEQRTPIDVRTNFDALAVFAPAVPTGPDGTATVEVTVPDNLTRYRVIAVAADTTDRFGAGESAITARLPLMVRPSAPRFVNFGDRFELPVVIHNQGDDDRDVEVVLEAANLSLTGSAGQRVTVPAGERVEVRFPVAAEDAGTARFRATAVSGDVADSSSGELPAYTPATTEAFATYGVVDDAGAVAQPLLAPEGVFPQFGGLEVDTSSTALQALTDAVVYLSDYPYESADAYASRIIALVALRDVFAAFATPGTPSPEEFSSRIRADIDELGALQNEDGGFSTWQRGRPTDPYATVQAAHALVAAAGAGYTGATGARDRALGYVANIEDHFPAEYPRSARHAVSAYALSVRALAGDRDPGKAEALYRDDPDLALDALAWLWPVVDDPGIDAAIEDTFADRVTETPAAATFTTDYEEGADALVLASDRRTDGIILDALITERPQSDLVPKVVAGLVGNQVKGRWNNVQENGFILLALKRYFDTFEAVDPAFVARVWLGDTYSAEHTHQGRSIDTTRTLVPMAELTGDDRPGTQDLVLAKDGPGRLYYRLGLRYAPTDLVQDPRDEGFVVERTYEAVDDPDDVRRDDDGTWHIAPGAMVRVRLAMVADSARTNMALVDPLPAGLEIVNPALVATPRPPPEEQDEGDDGGGDRPFTWFGWTWFDHQQSRDDRAEAFGSYLPAGTYDYTYVARATTPGTFVAPPAKAEEIYAPEVFGRSGTDTVVVSDG